jgi:hypothetical protein
MIIGLCRSHPLGKRTSRAFAKKGKMCRCFLLAIGWKQPRQ